MKLQVCAITDVGLARESNEDLFFVDEKQGLFIVADGMGGHAAGEIASQIAVETACQSLQEADQGNPPKQLSQAIEKANRAVELAAEGNKAWQGMGTTLTILLLHQQQGYLAHVGDSRIYRLRNSQFEQLSDDHSLVGEQLRQGILTPEQAKTSTLGNILLQAIGITPKLDICQKNIPLTAGDRFLLCSDGLTNMVSDPEIEKTLKQSGSLEPLCEALIKKAIAAGGKDNITVIVLQIDQLEGFESK
ncbi:MAG: Stp1/IreP family PP2C-type Ser/Thr phosphatase [Thermodesulfobacteriota bacterium]|nr:Stp1/IreP family PP2C-type Ser/Thr phosphatase [Thermodesulfobacteriota bacterium]